MATTALTSLPAQSDHQPFGPSNAFFDDPEADVVLRSRDFQTFRVLKLYIIRSSTLLGDLIRTAFDISSTENAASNEMRLPEVRLNDSGTILSSLLTFIFPIPAVLPSTLEETMELLSVAQKYEMSSVLTHIRGYLALQDPPFIRRENAFLAYSAAQRYGLRKEAAQAARLTLKFKLTIESLDDEHRAIPGPYLHELWIHHTRVRAELSSDLSAAAFKATLTGSKCARGNWVRSYVHSIIGNPSLFDPLEFQMALARHTSSAGGFLFADGCSSCAIIPVGTIRTFWVALTAAVHRCMEKAESELAILGTDTIIQSHIGLPATPLPLPECLDKGQADIILRTPDLARFPVHKSVLASSSPIFRDMFSLPNASNHGMIDGLPVVDISEDAELVRSLITMLYPIPSKLPASYDRVLALLAATQKYEMDAVKSSIRAEVACNPLRIVEVFRAYAIACSSGLTSEMGKLRRLTLDQPMTFEYLEDEMRSFEGQALRELVSFREQCRDNLVSCFESFLDIKNGPSKIWVGCPVQKSKQTDMASRLESRYIVNVGSTGNDDENEAVPSLPPWLSDIFTTEIRKLKQAFIGPLIRPSVIRGKYQEALQKHTSPDLCTFCVRVHIVNGVRYCEQLVQQLAHAREKASVISA